MAFDAPKPGTTSPALDQVPGLGDVVREAVRCAETGLIQEASDLLRAHVPCPPKVTWGRPPSHRPPPLAPRPMPPRVA
jgi:hypothetical protein